MRRALALSALLAWVMIQVPLVFCQSDCGESVAALISFETHTCHDRASDVHAGHCCPHEHAAEHAGCTEEECPEEDGHHVLVQVRTPAADAPCVLPLPDCVLALAPDCASLSSVSLPEGTARDLDPPPRVCDPVASSDRLQV